MSAVAVALFLFPASAERTLFQPMLRGPARAPVSYGAPEAYGSYAAERVVPDFSGEYAVLEAYPAPPSARLSAPMMSAAPTTDAGSALSGALLLGGLVVAAAALVGRARAPAPAPSPRTVALLSVRGDDELELGDIEVKAPVKSVSRKAPEGGEVD